MINNPSSNRYEAKICNEKKVIAHAECYYKEKTVYIRDLYVLQKYRGKGFGDVLLSKVLDYAAGQGASKIIVYCGPEPFCEDGQIPLDQEVSWYERHGFVHDHDVLGVTPCMIKTTDQEYAYES